MLQPDDYTVVGHVTKPHGFKGQLSIDITHDGAEKIETEWVMIFVDQKPVPFFVESIQHTGKGWLIKLEGVDSDAEATKLKGLEVGLKKEIVPVKEQSLEDKITGFDVIDSDLGLIGKVEAYLDHGAQAILQIKRTSGQDVMIPFVEEIVEAISESEGAIYVQLPEGLLEIND